MDRRQKQRRWERQYEEVRQESVYVERAEDQHRQAPQHEGHRADVLGHSGRHDQPQQHEDDRAEAQAPLEGKTNNANTLSRKR